MTTDNPPASPWDTPVPQAPPVALAPVAQPTTPTGRFLGSEGAFFGLLLRGNIFMLLTLGIYRFWLTTDIRRYLWGHTEVAGDTFEYTGTAKELLIGFLLALTLLLPINALIYVGTLLDPTAFAAVTLIGFVALTLLGQFAYYRARRYRLTRTVYRGVRFYQTGSAVRYSLVASLWGIAMLLTLGLLYPWGTASLERYKMRHTHFGNLTGVFTGSGTSLFFRGILIWLIALAPVFAASIAVVGAINWSTVGEIFAANDVDAAIEQFGAKNPAMIIAFGFWIGALVWAMIAGFFLYPIFRAINQRWWISGVRLGPITAVSKLRNGQIYWVYTRFILLSMAFGTAFSAFAGLFAGLVISLSGIPQDQFFTKLVESLPLQIVVGALAIIGYAAFLLGSSAVYQAAVVFRFWRLSFETTELSGLAALDDVIAAGEKSGVFGEGLADALDIGGI